MTGYKPEGYTSVSPYLIVPDAQRTLDFLAATPTEVSVAPIASRKDADAVRARVPGSAIFTPTASRSRPTAPPSPLTRSL